MMNMILQVCIGMCVLGILVLIHELGHFVAAKLGGIRVLTFSIGFGKPLFQKNVGGTVYQIGAIPVGGFVHMAGEHPEDTRENADDEFTSKPIWLRACVAMAGPAANYLSAIVILWIVYVAGVKQETYLDRPVVGAAAESSPALEAGFQPGDSIIRINGVPIRSWEDVENRFSRQETVYEISYIRGGREAVALMTVPAARGYGMPKYPHGGLLPALPPVIGAVNPGQPAAEAGLKPGDEISAIDGRIIHSWYELSHVVSLFDTARAALNITIKRADTSFVTAITPVYNEEAKRYLLGITVGTPPSRIVRHGLSAAFRKALDKTWQYTTMIFDVVGKLFTKKVSARQLAGPLGIVQMSGVAALGGLSAVLNFMALIGINLAMLNMFPLIITDGGLLLFLILEALRGKPLSRKHQEIVNRIAIAFFVGLFIFVTFNDIQRTPLFFRLISK